MTSFCYMFFYGGRMTLLASAMEPRVRRAYRVRGADSMLHVTRFTDGHEWHVPSSNRFLDQVLNHSPS